MKYTLIIILLICAAIVLISSDNSEEQINKDITLAEDNFSVEITPASAEKITKEAFKTEEKALESKPKEEISAGWLIEAGSKDDILHFLKSNSVNSIDSEGYPLLSQAFRFGRPDIAELLLKHGADVSTTDIDGGTPLHHATTYGELAMIRELIARNANIESTNHIGQTPLHLAIELGDLEVIQLLVDSGANFKAEGGTEAKSIIQTAVISGNNEIVDYFADLDKDLLNYKNKEGEDLVLYALKVGHPVLARHLQKLGVETEL